MSDAPEEPIVTVRELQVTRWLDFSPAVTAMIRDEYRKAFIGPRDDSEWQIVSVDCPEG